MTKEKQYLDALIKIMDCKRDFKNIRNLPEELLNDKEFIRILVNISPYHSRYASDELKNDQFFMMELIDRTNGVAYRYASEELRNMSTFSQIGVIAYPQNIKYIGDKLKGDSEFVQEYFETLKKYMLLIGDKTEFEIDVNIEDLKLIRKKGE